jgi:hypothetical protein
MYLVKATYELKFYKVTVKFMDVVKLKIELRCCYLFVFACRLVSGLLDVFPELFDDVM